MVDMVELYGRVQELVNCGGCGQEGGGGLPTPRHLARRGQIGEDMPVLLLACGDDGHDHCDKPGTLRAVGPKAPLARARPAAWRAPPHGWSVPRQLAARTSTTPAAAGGGPDMSLPSW